MALTTNSGRRADDGISGGGSAVRPWVTLAVSVREPARLRQVLWFASRHPGTVSVVLNDWDAEDATAVKMLDGAIRDMARWKQVLESGRHRPLKGDPYA